MIVASDSITRSSADLTVSQSLQPYPRVSSGRLA